MKPHADHPTHVRWLILGTVCLMYFITYIDRVNISVAAPSIREELHLSNTEMGIIFSAFSLTYALLQMPGGWLADLLGPRRALAGMGAVWSLMTALSAVPSSLATFGVVRAALGVAEGGAFPTATRAFAAWIPARHRGLAQGLPHSFARLGGAAAPPVVIALTLRYGWRASFVVLGVISAVWVLLWIAVYRNRPRQHPLVNQEEAELIESSASRRAASAGSPRTPWLELIKRIWPVTLADFCYGWSLWVFLTWMPTYLESGRGFKLQSLALFAALPLLAGVVGDTLGGLSSDFLWSHGHPKLARSGQISVGLLLSLAFVLPAAFTPSPIAAVWLLSASFLCLEMTNSPLWSMPMDLAPRYAGAASGMMNTGFGVAGIISPVIFGALVDRTGSWSLPFVVSSALLLAGAGVILLSNPLNVLEPEEHPAPSAPGLAPGASPAAT